MKNDLHAREHWDRSYDDIPKAVFATVAWHLANLASGNADKPGAAEARLHEEISALRDSGIIPASQAAAALKALEREAAQ